MLQLIIPLEPERWDEEKEVFIAPTYQTIQLEHSLVSLQKWESKWHKPFLSKTEKTKEEVLDYIKCMTLTPDVDPNVYDCLTEQNLQQVQQYINDPMTATTFSKNGPGKQNREIITAEIIYHWMIALTIPQEYRFWHLNSLLTLVEVCNIKNTPPKKQGKKSILASNATLNAQRRKQLNTKG